MYEAIIYLIHHLLWIIFLFICPKIKYIISLAKKELYETPRISINHLKSFFDANSAVPNDDDVFYFIATKIVFERGAPSPDTYNETRHQFHSVFTTKRLLRNVLNMDVIHVDATYKLLWQDFPLQIIGVSDKSRSFHVVGFCLSSNDTSAAYEFLFESIEKEIQLLYGASLLPTVKFVVADASKAIAKAVQRFFANAKKIVCWFHVKKNINKFKCNDPNALDEIVKDIDCLQLCSDERSFQTGCKLFEKKWAAEEKEFVEYFKSVWLSDANVNWYEGCAVMVPKTNNSLESFNGRLKGDFQFHHRYSLAVFEKKVQDMVATISNEYKDGVKRIHTVPVQPFYINNSFFYM